jgi:hypothetical protein
LYFVYTDQLGREMSVKTDNVTWTIVEGEGQFGEQTDTSIVFIPVATGKVVIEAREGELSVQKTLSVNSITSVFDHLNTTNVKVFPNPAGGMFQIEVFNLSGEKLLERNYNIDGQALSTLKLNTSGLNQGAYIYAIMIDSEVQYGRFIKYTDHQE